jgi:hypothetical protein
MSAALQGQNWEAAVTEMLDSTWAREVPARAHRMADPTARG